MRDHSSEKEEKMMKFHIGSLSVFGITSRERSPQSCETIGSVGEGGERVGSQVTDKLKLLVS